MPADRASLPNALNETETLRRLLGGRPPVVMLDFDGTLAPIVPRRQDAAMPEATRAVLRAVAAVCPLAVVSGRDLDDLEPRVGLDGAIAVGSHGYRMRWRDGAIEDLAGGATNSFVAAERRIAERLGGIDGIEFERKSHALTLHYRAAKGDDEARLLAAVRATADALGLRVSEGKKVAELLPAEPWHKGRAVETILARLRVEGREGMPVYLGDDTTDEDAFRAIAAQGVGIAVGDGPSPTAAGYRLEDSSEVERWLVWLLGVVPSVAQAGCRPANAPG